MHDERHVFHLRTPDNAEANLLVPLSPLRHTHPSVFADAIAKYNDSPERRRLPETWIPLLEARWIDAVFLSPVRPHAIWTGWHQITGSELPPQEFWAIPISAVTRPVLLDRQHSSPGEPINPLTSRRSIPTPTEPGTKPLPPTSPGWRTWLPTTGEAHGSTGFPTS